MNKRFKLYVYTVLAALLIFSVVTFGSLSLAKYVGQADFNITVYAPRIGSVKITQISGGLSHSLAIDENGQLYAWGFNDYGRIGNGYESNVIALPTELAVNVRFRYVNAGEYYSLGIDYEGNIYTWGVGMYGNHSFGSPATDYYVPHKMDIPGDPKFVKVCNTRGSSLALDIDGNIWAWGAADAGILGDGATNLAFQSTPQIITNFGGAQPRFVNIDVSYGDYPSALAVDDEGNIWGWGSNYWGELGFGNDNRENRQPSIVYTASTGLWSATPGTGDMRQVVHLPPGTQMKSVTIGGRVGGAVDEHGSIYIWGGNNQYDLGIGFTTGGFDYPPIQVYNAQTGEWTASASQSLNLEPGRRMVYYYIAYSSSYAIDELGNVYSWGRGDGGKLGIGQVANRAYPTRIYDAGTHLFTGGAFLPADAKIVSISGNRDFVFLRADDGSVFSIGTNTDRQLGDNTTVNRNIAVLISSGINGSAFPIIDGLEFPIIPPTP
jgi:alpha-tubulin suppressor-like RCC1 family protein